MAAAEYQDAMRIAERRKGLTAAVCTLEGVLMATLGGEYATELTIFASTKMRLVQNRVEGLIEYYAQQRYDDTPCPVFAVLYLELLHL